MPIHFRRVQRVFPTTARRSEAVHGLQERGLGLGVRHHEVKLGEAGGFVTGGTWRRETRPAGHVICGSCDLRVMTNQTSENIREVKHHVFIDAIVLIVEAPVILNF